MLLKKDMEEVLENDANELWALAARVGFLEQPVNSMTSNSTPLDDSPSNQVQNNNKPYLEEAMIRKG